MKKPTHRRPHFATGAVAGLACAGLLGTGLALVTGHSAEAAPGATATPIKHLVVIFDENVAFDHYFGTYPHAANTDGVRFTAATGTPTPKNLTSDRAIANNPNSTKPFRLSYRQAATCSQNHGYTAEQQAMNWVGGRALMNRFPQYTSHDSCTGRLGRVGLAMGYYDGNTVTGQWNYAQNFTLGDNFWANAFGPSTPGALEVVSGQTWGATAYTSTSDDSFPTPASPARASGLSAVDPATGIGTLIADPDPVYDDCANNNHTSASNVVGMQGQNIGDLLNAQGITWGWFQGGFTPTTPYAGIGSYAQCDSSHTTVAGNAVRDYSPHHNPFAYYQSTSNPHHLPPTGTIGQSDQANHQYDLSDFDTALAQDNLPAVSYLKAPAYQDGHQGSSDPIDEQHFLVNTINKIQQSPSWPSTAIILTYDDSDGSYDHVAPRIINGSRTADDAAICKAGPAPMLGQQDRCGPSQRLPFLLISPFARKNHIDHTLISQASVVRFIEDNWGLGRIGNGSYDATAGSLKFLFDFQHPQQRSVLLNSNGALYSVRSVAVSPAGGSATTLTVPAASGTYGKVASLSVSATSAGDVTGGVVTTTIDGRVGPSLPMYSAHGTLRLPATLSAGRHTVRLSFSGSADTLPADTTATVAVARASVALRAKAGKARRHKTKITITVIESGSSVRPTGTISGTVNGKRFSAAAVRNGVAHVTVKVRKGRNKVVLRFAGANYKPAKRALAARG